MTNDVASNRDRTSRDKSGDDPIDAWERVGPQWGRNRDRLFDAFQSASSWLIDHVDPQPGQTILELAAGPGETGFLAAERVGPTGRLISTDLAPSMVEAARLGAEARGLGNVDCRVMDAQHIDLPDASLDAVISRLGLMLVPEPRAAFREMRRVLRPGGRLAYAVLGTPDRNQWLSLFMGAAMEHGAAPAGDNPFALGGPFGLSSPEVNKELLRNVGFADVQAEELSGVMSFASASDYWDQQTALSPPVRAAIASMSPDEVASVRATLEQMLSSFESDGRYDLPTLVVVVAAR